jgi:hypothetical protein
MFSKTGGTKKKKHVFKDNIFLFFIPKISI